ncbi:GNS1/SUR4 family [Popillia japonica]|uniref:Elongation of very long chain fatty acids protein n=1 Tax=Popillia japonica TaxID=7064 RepID=A0AAW1LXC6_POPJA
MFNYLKLAKNYYNYILIELADPRTNEWFLVKHPVIWPIIFFYIYMVKKVGPRYMEHRKPFQLNTILIIYNFIQVIISIFLFKEGFYYGWFNGYSFRCQPVDYSMNPKAIRAAEACYYYFLAKIVELLDTVFFVLRKKNNQVTFLHVYHHSVMPLLSWGATKYYAGAMGPEYQKFLWWKKYITTIQLIQFCIIFLHGIQLLIYDCDFPRWTAILVMPNVIFFYYLFSDFYKKTYVLVRTPPRKVVSKSTKISIKLSLKKKK